MGRFAIGARCPLETVGREWFNKDSGRTLWQGSVKGYIPILPLKDQLNSNLLERPLH
jgi:hypothetical protein